MPEISVIVPVYRAESFLRKCTDSILNQTFQDLGAFTDRRRLPGSQRGAV